MQKRKGSESVGIAKKIQGGGWGTGGWTPIANFIRRQIKR